MTHHLLKLVPLFFLTVIACKNDGDSPTIPSPVTSTTVTTPITSTTSTPVSTTPITSTPITSTTTTSNPKIRYTSNDSLRYAASLVFGIDSTKFNKTPIKQNAQTIGALPGEDTFNSDDVAFIWKEIVVAGNYPKGDNFIVRLTNTKAKPRPAVYYFRRSTGADFTVQIDRAVPDPIGLEFIFASIFFYRK